MEKFGWTDTIYVGIGDFKAKEGKVKLNSLTLNQSFYGWYFAGCPITVEALPQQGYDFVKWEGINATSASFTIDPLEIKGVFYPVFKKKVVSKFAQSIKINELSCKQDSLADTGDWIELYNLGKERVDLSNWVIINKKMDSYTLPSGSFIEPKAFLIIARSPKKMKKHFDELDETVLLEDKMTIKLNAEEESLFIADQDGNFVDSIVYNLSEKTNSLDSFQNIIISKTNPAYKSLFNEFELLNVPTPGAENSNFEDTTNSKGSTIWAFFKKYQIQIASAGGGLSLLLVLLFIIRRRRKKVIEKK
jgi:hypothetical protein